ncbi:hypothetical protein [Natranaeroarchaeum sulfidigenes]|uniref:Uncharacterized protein n=1 Tax=Natranaeroarchaeum sulfidigenes TaxID=2784880 RepID=A0A897MTS3_9EURY|nr:hypothetical protein [Natranaeroarchaeum sulfidigenes]QSG02443.1 hypothetical protein AArcS_1226 [Natranaeroarchaeum sulfidigenes]
MKPDRFVTLCFLYAGTVLFAQATLAYGAANRVAAVFQLLTALAVLAAGIIRIRRPKEETDNPAEYGMLAYGMAALCIALTVISVGQLLLIA